MSLNPMLLKMLGNGESPVAQGAMESLMQQEDSMNPRMRLMMQLLARNNDAGASHAESADAHDDVDTIAEEQLRTRVSRLQDDLLEAEEMIDVFAESIGACASCFGGIADCPDCHGCGRSGWRMPDQRLFTHFVLPAVRRVNAESRKHSASATRQIPVVEGAEAPTATLPKLKGES